MLVAHCKAKLFPCGNTCPKRYNCIRNNFVYILCIKCVQSARCTTYIAYQVWCVSIFQYIYFSDMSESRGKSEIFSVFYRKVLRFPFFCRDQTFRILFIFFFGWNSGTVRSSGRYIFTLFVTCMSLDLRSDFICFVAFWRHLDANRSRCNSSHT